MLMFPQLFSIIPPFCLLHHTWPSWKQSQGAPSLDALVGQANHMSSCQCVGIVTSSIHPIQSLPLSSRPFLDLFWRPRAKTSKSNEVRHLYFGSELKGGGWAMVTIKIIVLFFCRFSFSECQLDSSVYQTIKPYHKPLV